MASTVRPSKIRIGDSVQHRVDQPETSYADSGCVVSVGREGLLARRVHFADGSDTGPLPPTAQLLLINR